jgi:hypothetical protein
MKQLTRLSLIVCGFAICCSLALSQNKNSAAHTQGKLKAGRIKTVYDKAKDETTMVLAPMTVSEVPGTIEASFPAEGATRKLPSATLQMVAYFSFHGKTLVTPRYVVVGFLSLSQGEYKYASDRELTVTADGSPLDLGEMKVADRRVDSGIQLGNVTFYRETLELPMKYEEFLRIAKAAKVSVRLGKTAFDLSADQREALRAIANRMQR